jgi:hypothetical protein
VLGSLLVAVVILAFILNPLIPLFRLALEGELLPKRLRDGRVGHHTSVFNRLRGELDDAGKRWVAFRTMRVQAETTLGNARNDTTATRGAADPTNSDAAVAAFDVLVQEIRARERHASGAARLPNTATAADAVSALAKALNTYPILPAAPDFDQAIFDRLNELQFQLLTKLDGMPELAYLALQEADARCRERFVPDAVKPTLLGNSRAAIEQYSRVAYNVDFQFLWTRLRMVLAKDATISAAVETASAQLDFAILVTALSAMTTVVWTVLLPWLGPSIAPFLVVAGLGPIAVLFFYRLVDSTQKALGAIAIMAIDGLRFELLRTLHLPLPSSLANEQKVWEGLELALYSAFDADIHYPHPKA